MAIGISPSTATAALSAADLRRVKDAVRKATSKVRKYGPEALDDPDFKWMESNPHSLWALLDEAVAASTAVKRDDTLVFICLCLLSNQLEVTRYHLERGQEWAREMLDAYQEKLVVLARSGTLSEGDWFALVKVLKDAKVPMRQEMMDTLLQAAVEGLPPGEAMPDGMSSPEDIRRQFSGMIEDIGRSVEDPFEVVAGLDEFATLMPGEMVAYITHELGLSSYAVLREAVPLLLLDPVPEVRRSAAAVLEQIAVPETFSSIMLRRTLLMRNWVPTAEREAIDRVIRKARTKGVVCAQWSPVAQIAIQCSVMDGSGAQSVILSNPKGRISLFAALLFKQSSGVAEAIYERSVPRSDITTGIKGLKQQGYSAEMDRRNLDVLVQHHIARGLASGNLPPIALVEIAEAVGASEWRDQAIDVQSETDRLFQSLDAEAKADSGIAASLQRVCLSLVKSPMLHSWFEDDADVLALVQGKPRPTKDVAVRRLVEELLPTRMDAWAERLLLLALWLRASNGANDRIWVDFVVLAHELLAGRPMADLPPMVMIAETSFTVASCW